MSSLDRPISPPPRKRPWESNDPGPRPTKKSEAATTKAKTEKSQTEEIQVVRSPIRLYTVTDLPGSENIDTVRLKDLFASPNSLDEIWSFNFMHNMDWFRGLIGEENEKRVKVRIVHGYWRQEDESRKVMEEGMWSSNVKLISAYLPDAFGTHHSKIIVIFRTDDTAQVLVQTGMIFISAVAEYSKHDSI
jgi:tyrosyl-DNA phosphodiesterase 1